MTASNSTIQIAQEDFHDLRGCAECKWAREPRAIGHLPADANPHVRCLLANHIRNQVRQKFGDVKKRDDKLADLGIRPGIQPVVERKEDCHIRDTDFAYHGLRPVE